MKIKEVKEQDFFKVAGIVLYYYTDGNEVPTPRTESQREKFNNLTVINHSNVEILNIKVLILFIAK